MAESHSTPTPEATKASSTAQPPVQDINKTAEKKSDRTEVIGDRVMRAVGGGSPQTPPSKFAGALGQLGGAAQRGMLRKLQRSYGNSYVGSVIQAKLTVGQPGDVYEEEADLVADAVMRMPEPDIAPSASVSHHIQPLRIQRMCTECWKEEEERIHPKESPGQTPTVTPRLEAQLNATSGSGQPLPEGTRSFMESRFGQDFSGVQVHTGSEAAQMNRELRAQAFTRQRDIYFGAGKYNLDSSEGQRLLAHELTHVIQQTESQQGKLTKGFGFNQGMPLTKVPDVRIQRDDPPEGSSSERRAHSEQPAALRGLSGGSRERAIMGARATRIPRSHLQPLSEEHSSVLERVIPNTSLYESIREREQRLEELSDLRTRLHQYELPPGGLPEEGSSEAQSLASIEERIQALEQEIERLDTQIQEGLSELNLERPEQLVALVTEEFPRVFKERAKQIADAELEHNREIALEEAERYGIQRRSYPARSTEQISQNRRALRVAAQDLVTRDRQIEELQRASEQQLQQREISPERRFSRRGRYIRMHTRLSIPVSQLQRERERKLQEYKLRFPILHVIEPQVIATGSDRELSTAIGSEIDEILGDIEQTQINIRNDDVKIWDLPMVMERTKQDLGISSNPILLAAIDNHVQEERTEELYLNLALAALAITAGIVASIASGGALSGTFVGLTVRLIAGSVSLGISGYQLSESVETYLAESAASNVALERHLADISNREPELAWVILDLGGLGLDALDILRALPLLRQANRSLMLGGEIDEFEEAARRALPESPEAASSLTMTARAVQRSETITSETLPNISRRLDTEIEIDNRLGRAIEVHYEVNSRGRIIATRVLCGSDAIVSEILAHAGVIRLLRRYDGVIGRIRELIDRLRSLTGRVSPNVNPFPPGSQAFESWLEVNKLPEIIEARRAALGNALGTEAEPILRRDVEFLESELAYHRRTVDQMVLERGSGFVARAEESTAEAIRAGMPELEGHELISDASRYYYRTNPTGQPPYQLVRFAEANVPARTLVADGHGGWRISEGALSRSERSEAIVSGWSDEVQTGFQNLTEEFQSAFRVVPLEGVATTGRRIGELDPELAGNLHEILFEAYRRAGDPDPFRQTMSAVADVTQHEITVVRGTDQLRAYNYRLNFANETGEAASGDLHHLIPLYLGGEHRRLVDMPRDLHDRLHDLIDEIPFEGGTTLVPHSIQRSGSLSFSEGAAVLNNNGTVQLFRFNPDGGYTRVP